MVIILNGVMGDHLVTHDNPLAVSMMLYDKDNYVQSGALSGRVSVLCHGLCLSHLSWQVAGENNLRAMLTHKLPERTVIYLSSNTVPPSSSNGRSFPKVLP